MIHFTKNIFLGLLILFFIGLGTTHAGIVDHFNVTLTPNNAKIGEAVDLEIEAVDKDNNTVNDYVGIVLIYSESGEVELPSILEENTYIFKETDQGKVKFENAIKFKNQGTQDIHVNDFDEDAVMGVGEILIQKEEQNTALEIGILSPESGLTIPENKIIVSGASKKNHLIQIVINQDRIVKATTNNQGLFEKEIDNLDEGENVFKAQVLNADETVVGESETVRISVQSELPRLKNIKIQPKEVNAENSFDVEVITNEGLSEVALILNETLTKLQKDEKNEALWKKTLYAPEKSGNYQIDIILKDDIGHEVKELGADNILVKALELESASAVEKPKIYANGNTIETPGVTTKELDIKGIKVVELKSKSIITWDKTEGAESYNVYQKLKNETLELIGNVREPKFEIEFSGDKIKYDYFVISAVRSQQKEDSTNTASGEIYEGSLSDATKVQTGPEILLLIILALFGGGFFLIKGKNT